jgi:hypothetical protein
VKVLVSIPHGGAAGNMLRSGIVRRVLDADPSIEIVLATPLAQDPSFVAEFSHNRVTFEPLSPHRPRGLEGRLQALVQAAYITSGVTESVRIRRQEALAKGSIRWMRSKRLIASALAPSIVQPRTRYDLTDRLVSHPEAEALFDRHRPSLYVASSPGLIFAEIPLLRTAARRRVPSMAIDPSWDNFTNKLLPVRRVDQLVVWNELMRDQAVELHGYRPEEVRVAGAPHWDLYFRPGATTRDAFYRRIGADPTRKLVTLTTTSMELYPHYERVLRVLIDAMDRGSWPHASQLLVRVHPRDELERYRPFMGMPHVIVEKPFRETVKTGDGLAVDITAETQRHLADTMQYSDVVVQVASTIAIEAAVFDTPVVNISFDGETPAEDVRSARRYLRFNHFANIVRSGGVRLADTPEALVQGVGAYLSNPELDADGRRRVVREQCQFLDGRSAERVAACVVAMLEGIKGRSTRPAAPLAAATGS